MPITKPLLSRLGSKDGYLETGSGHVVHSGNHFAKGECVATPKKTDTSFPTPPSHQGDKRLLSRIAMRKLGNDGVEERMTLLPVEEILYFFTAGAVSQRTVIDAKWRESKLFSPGRVYVRTAKGLFVTRYRTLGTILARLPDKFVEIHKSLVVNSHKILDLEFSSKLKQVSVVTAASTEWLTVSRRALKRLRLALGL